MDAKLCNTVMCSGKGYVKYSGLEKWRHSQRMKERKIPRNRLVENSNTGRSNLV